MLFPRGIPHVSSSTSYGQRVSSVNPTQVVSPTPRPYPSRFERNPARAPSSSPSATCCAASSSAHRPPNPAAISSGGGGYLLPSLSLPLSLPASMASSCQTHGRARVSPPPHRALAWRPTSSRPSHRRRLAHEHAATPLDQLQPPGEIDLVSSTSSTGFSAPAAPLRTFSGHLGSGR